MTTNADYQTVSIDPIDDGEEMPDVHLFIPADPDAKKDDPDYGRGLKLDLPNLNSEDLPIDVIQAVLLTKSAVNLTDEQNFAVASTMLAYFQVMQPNYWNFLRRQGRPMAYLAGTVKAWAEQSGLDPKALSSSISKAGTAPRWTTTGSKHMEPYTGR